MIFEVTDKSSATFDLSGTVDVTAKTSIGEVPISGIPFDVSSTLKGINLFGGKATINNVSITGSGGTNGDQYIIAPLTTAINNPSNVSLSTVDIALPVYYENVMIGRAAFNTFNLVPGENSIAGEFHYESADANDTVAESFLTSFVQSGNVLPLTVKGDGASSPFTSLDPALEGVALQTSITGLNVPPIITHLYATISLSTLATNEVELNFDIYNPLGTDLVIEYPFSNFVIPPGKTVNSGTFSQVLLTKGALESLGIIPLGYMDVQSVATTRIAVNGYQIPWLHINQIHVTTDYNLGLLSLVDLSSAAQSLTGSLLSGTSEEPSSSSPSSTGNVTGPSSTSANASSPLSSSAGSSTQS